MSAKLYDKLMRMSTVGMQSQTAYVDTCGSKVFVRDGYSNFARRPHRRPIHITRTW